MTDDLSLPIAIGDPHGCVDPLRQLLDALPTNRPLVFVGDLVNRGPDSPGVLRLVRALVASGRARCVLGNHDLHLLACAAGLRTPRAKDTIADVLHAPDRDDLLAWLGQLPLAFRAGPWLVTHAGVHPTWTDDDALSVSSAWQHAAQNDADRRALLHAIVHFTGTRAPDEHLDVAQTASVSHAPAIHPSLAPLAYRIGVLTRIRCVDCATGELAPAWTGPLAGRPRGVVPWFDPRAPGARSDRSPIVFGHWAAIGPHRTPNALGTDSGCAWGHRLSAVDLASFEVTSVPGHRAAPGPAQRSLLPLAHDPVDVPTRRPNTRP